MSKNTTIFICFLCFYKISFSQESSVKIKVIQQIETTRKVFSQDITKANKIIDSALNLAASNNLEKELAQAYNIKGFIFYAKGKIDSAMFFYNKSETLGNKIGDIIVIGRAKQNKGSAYNALGKYVEGLQLMMQALKIYEQANDKPLIAKCYSDIANTLIRQNNSNEAVKYLIKGIELAKEVNDERTILINLNSLGVVYENLKEWGKAKETYLAAIDLAKKQNNSIILTILYLNIGKISAILLEKDGGTDYFLKAEEIAKKNNDKVRLALIYQNLGRNLYRSEKYDKALSYSLAAKELLEKNKDQYALEKVYSSLTDIYHKIGDYEKSYQYSLKKDTLSKELYNSESLQKINEINTKYQTEKKQNELNILNKQNQIQSLELNKSKLENLNKKLLIDKTNSQLNYQNLVINQNQISLREKELQVKNDAQQINLLNEQTTIQKLQIKQRNQTIVALIVASLLIVIIGYLFYIRYKLTQKTELQNLLSSQQELAAKAVIEAEEKERKRISGDLHDGLGQLLSVASMNLSVLGSKLKFEDMECDKAYNQTVNLLKESYQEMRSISHQMMPNALLKNGLPEAVQSFLNEINPELIQVSFHAEGFKTRLDSNVEIVLYRVIQECINNVIKHAKAQHLDVQMELLEKSLNCIIEDNGVGFDKTAPSNGIGINNIRSRVNFIKGNLDISSSPKKGTSISIYVPILS